MNPQNSSHATAARTITCPACGGPSRYASDNAFRPFCSQRCRSLDLGAWASERYRVGATAATNDESNERPDSIR